MDTLIMVAALGSIFFGVIALCDYRSRHRKK